MLKKMNKPVMPMLAYTKVCLSPYDGSDKHSGHLVIKLGHALFLTVVKAQPFCGIIVLQSGRPPRFITEWDFCVAAK